MANIERKNKGRQKVAMVRMEKESNRLVTFSKRRSGLFKKTSELCTLCGAEAAIIVFSPGRKAFSFGHPSVDATINRFILSDIQFNRDDLNGQPSETPADPNVVGCNVELTIVNNQMEFEKKRYEELINGRKLREEDYRWLKLVEECGIQDLKRLQESLTGMRSNLYQMYDQVVVEVDNTRNILESTYDLPPEMMGRDNGISTVFGGHPHQMMMVGSSSNFDHSQMMMIQAPMGGFGDPSLTMGSNGIAMEHLLDANSNANADGNALSMSNPMGLGFPDPNLMPSFQGGNNPVGGRQFDGLPPLPSLNAQRMNPMSGNFQNFPSVLPGADAMDAPTAPFNLPNGFGFGNGNEFN